MILKFRFFLALNFIFFGLFISAQAPGYMGKKFTLGYGFYASPAWVGSQGATVINKLHEGFVEGVVAKKIAIGFSARFYNAIYSNTREVEVKGLNSYSNYSANRRSPSGQTYIKARNYMAYCKFFKNNYLAPWGKYRTLGITLNTFVSSYDPDQMYITIDGSSQTTIYYSDFGYTSQSFKKIDIMLGKGRSRIIANRILLDYGYNVNVFALLTTVVDAFDDNLNEDNLSYVSTYIADVSAARIRGVNRFNIFLKIGFII